MEIDDSLYSRQRYVLGDTAMLHMAKSSVFLSGLGGLGVEIAKNIVLAGVKSLCVHDTHAATTWDLGTHFFLDPADVEAGVNRAVASVPRLAELNPYVEVRSCTEDLHSTVDLSFLRQHQCVILTGCSIRLQSRVDEFCRTQQPPIKFISADVYGVFCRAFCDFGPVFHVWDPTGEETKEIFIQNITQGNPGVVTCIDNKPHGLQEGDRVTFKEVYGMEALNGMNTSITVINSYTFGIGNTSQLPPYKHGGLAKQLKAQKTFTFEPLKSQLQSPSCLLVDLSKPEAPLQSHFALLALNEFNDQHGHLPSPSSLEDAETLYELAVSVGQRMRDPVEPDRRVITCLSVSSQGCFPPLVATLGGLVAQEALKALTGKFSPLFQWFYLDAIEVMEKLKIGNEDEFLPRRDRYDALRMCVGHETCKALQGLQAFMVGCGAIGCEMLKNMAVLGVGTEPSKGLVLLRIRPFRGCGFPPLETFLVTITDPDLIEKSNLNRQFLFRPRHIQQAKSSTAAEAARAINRDIQVDARLDRVGPATEEIYSDAFISKQQLVVTALDNVEARRYMDSRCVANQSPLLDSGTLGTKGHVEVVIPHLTESYNSQRDPPEEEIPFCTLKSFPAVIEHTIQWARDKFESSFAHKPATFSTFWEKQQHPHQVLQDLQVGRVQDSCIQAIKYLGRRPCTWDDCVVQARLKFEKYFNHKAKQLLHAFPLDTQLKDGSLFWQSPKRPPTPQTFDPSDELHFTFIMSAARQLAAVCDITFSDADLAQHNILSILERVTVPDFQPSDKHIITDETLKADQMKSGSSSQEEALAIGLLSQAIDQGMTKQELLRMTPLVFEKDCDANAHVDFVTAVSNLRARMYGIELASRLETKRIAGRIIPAIATTTATVSGLVALEMVKVVQGAALGAFKNCFLNLALPIMLFSEPAPAIRTPIRGDLSFTIWDKWTVQGNDDFTLQDLITTIKAQYGVKPTMVVQGVKMIYVPVMPGHSKRLKQTMNKLLKQQSDSMLI
uniref:ubiquitin-like modifier-activating enzyme 6 isoform X2 n=1 Tax=Myxine glutinosa TaxID=7769 RepID=UPI00358F725B